MLTSCLSLPLTSFSKGGSIEPNEPPLDPPLLEVGILHIRIDYCSELVYCTICTHIKYSHVKVDLPRSHIASTCKWKGNPNYFTKILQKKMVYHKDTKHVTKILPPPAVIKTPTGREADGGWWVALPVRRGAGYT